MFAFVNTGIGILHLARQVVSNEGFICVTDSTCFTIASIASSFSPRVALRADSGSFKKNADAIVTVPGSDVGKLAMNCAGVHWRFSPKCIKPATQSQLDLAALVWGQMSCTFIHSP